MIDWLNVALNGLWISGCAIALAAVSYASWAASIRQDRLSNELRRPAYWMAFGMAGLLFCIGLAGTARVTWEKAIWMLLAGGFLVLILAGYRHNKASPP